MVVFPKPHWCCPSFPGAVCTIFQNSVSNRYSRSLTLQLNYHYNNMIKLSWLKSLGRWCLYPARQNYQMTCSSMSSRGKVSTCTVLYLLFEWGAPLSLMRNSYPPRRGPASSWTGSYFCIQSSERMIGGWRGCFVTTSVSLFSAEAEEGEGKPGNQHRISFWSWASGLPDTSMAVWCPSLWQITDSFGPTGWQSHLLSGNPIQDCLVRQQNKTHL